VLTGISIVSFFFNRTPAKMFLGDSGAQTLGYFVATLCILLTRKNPHQLSSYIPPVLLLGVPIFNITMVVFSRVRRGIPVYKARLDQIYHRLVKIGFKGQMPVFILHIISLMLSVSAFLTFYIPPIWDYVLFCAVFLIGFSMLIIMDNKKIWA
jgi:UDP-GlcNAc:undecaprenyl-phosphate GlcNAc-1-phosphate transferase